MKKLWLIIKREYFVRVRKKSFILITLLAPLAIIGFYAALIFIAVSSKGDDQKIAFKDDSGIFKSLPSQGNVHFESYTGDLEELRKTYKEEGYNGVLHIPAFSSIYNNLKIQFYSDQQISISNKRNIERRVERKIRDFKMIEAGLSSNQLDSLETNVTLVETKEKLNAAGELEGEESTASAGIAAAISFGMSFFMYMVIFIYGMMVMRSVMEEKVNRIVEVIISSVKPFQLMLGKIIGVSGVGLTQMVIWIGLVFLGQLALGPLLLAIGGDSLADPSAAGVPQGDMDEMMANIQSFTTDFAAQDWSFMLPIILIFFVGGYFIYASLFAAVGSAIGDDQGEAQTLTIPIVLPVVIAFAIATTAIENPNSSLAVFGSIFPLFSPIVMPARLAFDPPMWQLLLSIAVLIGSVLFFVWLSGRIYRIGIFMYGKKVTLKEIGKWLFYKG